MLKSESERRARFLLLGVVLIQCVIIWVVQRDNMKLASQLNRSSAAVSKASDALTFAQHSCHVTVKATPP